MTEKEIKDALKEARIDISKPVERPVQKPFEVNEVQELPDGKMNIIVTGILDYSTSEIRDILEEAFANNKPDPDNR